MANDAASSLLGADLAAGLAEIERQASRASATRDGAGRSRAEAEPDESGHPRTVQVDDARWIEITTYPADLGGGSRGSPLLEDRRPP